MTGVRKPVENRSRRLRAMICALRFSTASLSPWKARHTPASFPHSHSPDEFESDLRSRLRREERGLARPSTAVGLQAHSSIRKCSMRCPVMWEADRQPPRAPPLTGGVRRAGPACGRNRRRSRASLHAPNRGCGQGDPHRRATESLARRQNAKQHNCFNLDGGACTGRKVHNNADTPDASESAGNPAGERVTNVVEG